MSRPDDGHVDRAGDRDADAEYRKTQAFYEFLCPSCSEPATTTVALGGGVTHRCAECETSWQAGDRDNCAKCDKPLGSAATLCYTCRASLEVVGDQ